MCDVLLILHEAMLPSGLAELSWIEAKNKQTKKKKISTLEISLLKYLQSACFHIHAATCSLLRALNELRENGIASNLLSFPV